MPLSCIMPVSFVLVCSGDCRPLKIRFIVPDRHGVCTRQRVELFVPHLERVGHEVDIVEFPKPRRLRRQVLVGCGEVDVVVLLRRLLVWTDYRRLRRHARRLVYDYDDALWLRDPSRKNPVSRSRRRRLFRILKGVDQVIAGNEVLAGLARRFCQSVAIVPTVVDTDTVVPTAPTPGDSVTLGWIGSGSTVQYLGLIEGALRRVAERHPTVRLTIVSDEFGDFDFGMTVEKTTWTLENQLADLQSIDIGLMPLSDDPWSRGKCAFKLVQYGAVGRPSVASPVGANCQVVDDGRTGYLAADESAWVEHLCRLVDDAALRRRMGEAARDHIVNNYSVQSQAPHVMGLVTGDQG